MNKIIKKTKEMKETREDLIKEVQRLSIAKHSKKELDKFSEGSLRMIIQFKKSLGDVNAGRINKK